MTKEEFANYYYSHSNRDMCEYFNIKKSQVNKLLKEFNLSAKTKEQKYALVSNTIKSKSQSEKDIIEHKRQSTCIEKYGDTNPMKNLSVQQKVSDILQSRTEKEKQSWIDSIKTTIANKSDEEKSIIRQHRSEATKAYFAKMSDDKRQQFSKTMSDVYKNLPDNVKEERKKKIAESFKKTCLEKYGVENTLQLDNVKERVQLTNEERYGVPYFCMHHDCRSALGGNSSNSNPNKEFANLLKENDIEYEQEFNLEKYSYDFKVGNTLIEINPTATHNSTFSPFGNPISKTYHRDKLLCAEEHGYRCVHIFDWDNKEKIVHLLNGERNKLYARKCQIQEVSKERTIEFLNTYHLQGYAKDSIRLGLYYNAELVSIMTFDKPRYNKNFDFEIIRYCSNADVIGGAEKLFKYFCNCYPNTKIISYCDLSKFNGKTYKALGFSRTACEISKHWYNQKTGVHITDNLLRSRGFDQLFNTSFGKGTSNEHLMFEHGFVEIYDCGQATYVFNI